MSESSDDGGDVVTPPLATASGRNGKTPPTFACGNDDDVEYHFLPIDAAIERVGTGTFQLKILLAAGLCFMADAMEVLLLSFLSTVLRHEWNLSEQEVDSIVAIVFAGAVIGTLVLGTAGDVFGRKPVFCATASLIAVAGTATAVCRTYEEILLARFWVGFGIGGLTVPFDTLGEFLPGAARGKNLLYIGA
jgi:MFS family permease